MVQTPGAFSIVHTQTEILTKVVTWIMNEGVERGKLQTLLYSHSSSYLPKQRLKWSSDCVVFGKLQNCRTHRQQGDAVRHFVLKLTEALTIMWQRKWFNCFSEMTITAWKKGETCFPFVSGSGILGKSWNWHRNCQPKLNLGIAQRRIWDLSPITKQKIAAGTQCSFFFSLKMSSKHTVALQNQFPSTQSLFKPLVDVGTPSSFQ